MIFRQTFKVLGVLKSRLFLSFLYSQRSNREVQVAQTVPDSIQILTTIFRQKFRVIHRLEQIKHDFSEEKTNAFEERENKLVQKNKFGAELHSPEYYS